MTRRAGTDDQRHRGDQAELKSDRIDDARVDPDQRRPREQHDRESSTTATCSHRDPGDRDHHRRPPNARSGNHREGERDHAAPREPATDRSMPSQQHRREPSDDRQMPSADCQHRSHAGVLRGMNGRVVEIPAITEQDRRDQSAGPWSSGRHRLLDELDRVPPASADIDDPLPPPGDGHVRPGLDQTARRHHQHGRHAIPASAATIAFTGIARRRNECQPSDDRDDRARCDSRVRNIDAKRQSSPGHGRMSRPNDVDLGAPSRAIVRTHRLVDHVGTDGLEGNERAGDATGDPDDRIDPSGRRMIDPHPDLVRQHPDDHECRSSDRQEHRRGPRTPDGDTHQRQQHDHREHRQRQRCERHRGDPLVDAIADHPVRQKRRGRPRGDQRRSADDDTQSTSAGRPVIAAAHRGRHRLLLVFDHLPPNPTDRHRRPPSPVFRDDDHHDVARRRSRDSGGTSRRWSSSAGATDLGFRRFAWTTRRAGRAFPRPRRNRWSARRVRCRTRRTRPDPRRPAPPRRSAA